MALMDQNRHTAKMSGENLQGSFTWEDVLLKFCQDWNLMFGSLRLPEPCKLSLVVW